MAPRGRCGSTAASAACAGCLDEKGYVRCAECGEFAGRSSERFERMAAFCLGRGEDVRASSARLSRDPEGWLREQG